LAGFAKMADRYEHTVPKGQNCVQFGPEGASWFLAKMRKQHRSKYALLAKMRGCRMG
jgi:hypothetical protein